jgi:hypothetical protein
MRGTSVPKGLRVSAEEKRIVLHLLMSATIIVGGHARTSPERIQLIDLAVRDNPQIVLQTRDPSTSDVSPASVVCKRGSDSHLMCS